MASPEQPPSKRQRLSPFDSQTQLQLLSSDNLSTSPIPFNTPSTPTVMGKLRDVVAVKEAEVGILHYVNSDNPGFTGVLKQRYTDFLVNEIVLDGTVLHLTTDKAPFIQKPVRGSGHDQSPTNGKDDEPIPDQTKSDPSSAGAKKESTPPIIDTKSDTASKVAASDTTNAKADDTATAASVEESNTEKPLITISSEDDDKLNSYFGSALKDEIIKLYGKILAKPNVKPTSFGSLLSEPITDRALRGRLHQDVRRIFSSRIETESINNGSIKITAAAPLQKRQSNNARTQNPRSQNATKGKLGWKELGGEHLHFSLYKENKDTMEVISYLARALKTGNRDFRFAGTKDRRAVTVQRVSVFRQHAKRMADLNRSLRAGSRIGDFKYEKHALELGELAGNQFIVTLRDCHFDGDEELDEAKRLELANKVVSQAVKHLQDHGFLNYFGLQRFGTFSTGTDEIGKLILKDDFEGAVWAILTYSDEALASAMYDYESKEGTISRDDVARAHAIHAFKTTGQSKYALETLPRKFSAESSIIRHLSAPARKNDFVGALTTISRNLRTMYVHAYQSLVWNMAASQRWVRYGDKVIAGDLVYVDSSAARDATQQDEIDESGEVVVHPAEDDIAVTADDVFQRARSLTTEEAASGKYSIFDVVLPTPGFDIEYPANDIGDYYKEFMGSDRGGGLDPADMRRKNKDFSLSGSYRKLLAKTGNDLSFEVKIYQGETEQLVETDLEKLQKSRPQQEDNQYSQSGRSNAGPRDDNNGYRNNGFDGRGSRFNNRQSRFNDFFTKRNGDQNKTSAPKQPPTSGQAYEIVDEILSEIQAAETAKINAWKALPAKLAADDKASAAAYEAAKLTAKPINPDDIIQPVYKETFIQTSAENEGRRTGYRTTQIIGPDGLWKAVTKESKVLAADGGKTSNSAEAVSLSAPTEKQEVLTGTEADEGKVVDAPLTTTTKVPKALTNSVSAEIEMDTNAHSLQPSATNFSFDVGVKLESPSKKRAAEGISTLAPSGSAQVKEQGINDEAAPVEEPQPARIAVIVKFALGSSQYATMALRELMKQGGVKTYKPDFSGGR